MRFHNVIHYQQFGSPIDITTRKLKRVINKMRGGELTE